MHTNPTRREWAICCAIASLAVASCDVDATGVELNGSRASTAGHAAVAAIAPPPHSGVWLRSGTGGQALAQGMDRDELVRVRLRELAAELGLSESALAGAEIERSQRLPTGGRIVQVAQRTHGIPVFQARASLILDRAQQVVAITNQLSPTLSDDALTPFELTPEAALASFYNQRTGAQLSAASAPASGPSASAPGAQKTSPLSAADVRARPSGPSTSAPGAQETSPLSAADVRARPSGPPAGAPGVQKTSPLSAADVRARPSGPPAGAPGVQETLPLSAAEAHAGAAPRLAAAAVWADAARPGHYTLQTPALAPRVLEATAKRAYFPSPGQLIAAFHVELMLRDARGVNHAYAAVIDARAEASASPLWAADLTAFEAFNYRVWAEADGTHVPTDGPLVDATPYPGGAPDRRRPDFRAPILVSMEGFNHNPQGAADPWLGADAKETLGNNVSAYTDRDAYTTSRGFPRSDGFTSGDVRADVTAARTFDYSYDPARAPEADASQLKASVTQVFYVNNWLHDFWYDSGFDEQAGNAQADNYGRGGEDGDPLRAEAQDSADSGATNNANMSVLGDGTSPRMQMYVWNGLPVRALETVPALSFEDELGAASYGPQTFDISGALVLVDDGSTSVSADSSTPVGTVTDACQRLPDLGDRIAVVERGGCTFVDKIANLERANAKAALILDNAPGHTAVNPSVEDPPEVSLPLLALSYEDGQKLKALLQGTNETPPTAARFFRGPETMRDGTVDNTVVAHEWGHYLHHRLVSCASLSCAGMSEGWGDFVALMLVVRDGDSFDNQVFPLSQYATGGLSQNAAYFGIRRAPYSTDLSKNPFTFKHIREAAELPTGAPLAPTSPEMNEVHNVGEIWAAMLFEVYVNVIKAGQAAGRPFAESQRRMADYVVAGLKAAPSNTTFIEQRDALIASVEAMARDDASRQADVEAFKQGFAKRGLGAGAVAPPSSSTTLNEAVESFEAQPSAARAP